MNKALNLTPETRSKICFSGISTDSRSVSKGDLFVALIGDNFDGHDFISKAVKNGAEGLVVSRPVQLEEESIPIFRVEDTLEALGDLAKYLRVYLDIIVVAITGSTGKTGTKDLIQAAKLNTAPYGANIGRGLKVSKEDMVAMWAAVKRFVNLDHKAEQRRWNDSIKVISAAIRDIPSVKTRTIVPPIANHVPHLLIDWDEQTLPLTPGQLKQQLAAGDPAIVTARVHGTGSDGFLISVFMLQKGEDAIVGRRLKSILSAAKR